MAEDRQVKCLLLPVTGPAIIVPNSAVAEIITQQDILPIADAPAWLLGTGRWRGTDIPLIAFDRLVGERGDVPEPAGRFVVLFGLDGDAAPGFYGIRIDQLPRTETVDRERLRTADGEAHGSDFVGMRAVVGGDRECIVPDLDAVGRALARYHHGSAA